MSSLAHCTGISLLVLAVVSIPNSSPTSSTIPDATDLRSRASTWGAVEVALTARMVTRRAGRDPSAVELRILRGGRTRTRIDFLSPAKDKGKVLLQLDNQAWLYLPKAKRVVKVPPRRHLLADGLLFEDLFADEPDLAAAQVQENDDAYILITSPEGTLAGKKHKSTRVYFHRDTLLPFQREFYGSSGQLLRAIYIEEIRHWNDLNLPWKIRFVDYLRHGTETTLEVLVAEALPDNVEDLFSRELLAHVPAGTGNSEDD